MKTKKLLFLILAMALVITCFAACGKQEDAAKTTAPATKTEQKTEAKTTADTAEKADDTAVRIATLKGPTGMGMAKLITDEQAKSASNYSFTISSAPDEVTASIINGEIDIAALPVNLAAVLNKKTEGAVKVAAVNTLGVLYILENGNTINSISDLKGKTIAATGQASTPEYTLRYLLSKNGIDPDKDVTITYYADHAELATLMASKECDIAMLPEPNVSTVLAQNADARIALNLTDEWNKLGEGELVQGCIVVQSAFIEAHPAAVEQFLKAYKASVDFVNDNEDEAASMIEALGIVPKAAIAKKALPNCNICYIEGDDMKSSLESFFKVLFAAEPKSIGGSMPDDSFYYSK